MDLNLIKKPVITEKSTANAQFNKYIFEVNKSANKSEIKATIEDIYKVKVEKLNSVITSTSANISSEPPAKNADEVRNLFGDEVSILEGELGGADKPTPIQNLITDEWIRN